MTDAAEEFRSERIDNAVRDVTKAYSRFDVLRVRTEPFDEGDFQNVHAWMGAVTRWIEEVSADADV